MTNSKAPMMALTLLVFLHLLVAGAFSIWNPLAEAPDEADHFAYVRLLAAKRGLAIGPQLTQGKHPPLYHIVATLAASLGDPLDYRWLRANPDLSIQPTANWSPNFFIHTTLEEWPWSAGPLAFHLARFVSVLLSTLTVLATYWLVRLGFPEQQWLAIASAALLAVIPEFAFIGGAVNNDNGAALMGTLTLAGALLLLRQPANRRAIWWLPIVMGMGLLTKVSLLALWPVVLVGAIAGASLDSTMDSPDATSWLQGFGRHWRRAVITCAVILLTAALFAAPWFLRNWRLYGDPLGYSLMQQTVDVRSAPWSASDTYWLVKGWFVSFWGKFGAVGHLPYPGWVYWLLGVFSVASLFGLLKSWWLSNTMQRLVLFMFALAVVGVAVAIWRYSLVALGTDQGRLLYPAVGAIVTLFVVGLSELTLVRFRPGFGVVGSGLMAFLAIYGLIGVILPAYAPPKPITSSIATERASKPSVTFGPLALVDWTLESEPVLLWRMTEATAEDYRITLRVIAEDGTLVWEWNRSPGYGRWSTDHWEAGETYLDEYEVVWPEWAGSGQYLLEVGVRPYDGEYVTASADGKNINTSESPYVPLGWFQR